MYKILLVLVVVLIGCAPEIEQVDEPIQDTVEPEAPAAVPPEEDDYLDEALADLEAVS